MSTNENRRLLRENFIPVETHKDGSQCLDIFHPNYARLCRRIRDFGLSPPYDGQTSFENFCNRYYDTTTPWWIVLAFNGYVHPSDVQAGTVLRMPSLAELSDIAQQLTGPKSKRGEKVTI